MKVDIAYLGNYFNIKENILALTGNPKIVERKIRTERAPRERIDSQQNQGLSEGPLRKYNYPGWYFTIYNT